MASNSPNTMRPILVHTDLFRAQLSLGRTLKLNGDELLTFHANRIFGIFPNEDYWFPTFNMDFSKTRVFNPEMDISQVGAINEYLWKQPGFWRTKVPYYSVAGNSHKPRDYEITKPKHNLWGEDTFFQDLIDSDGKILFYGSKIDSCTFIHFFEETFGPPSYRYDKEFQGDIVEDGLKCPVTISMHVRPKGRHFDYDWDLIWIDLRNSGILNSLDESRTFFYVNARQLFDFWISKVRDDDLYFLDQTTKEWVSELLFRIGRRFQILDFEKE